MSGSSFLALPEELWALSKTEISTSNTLEEQSKVACSTVVEENGVLSLNDRHSSLSKMQRIFLYLLQFVRNSGFHS